MSSLSNFLCSLLLTTLVSFAAPIILVGTMLATLSVASYIPGLTFLGQTGATQILEFLAVFGSSYPVQGILTIGFACGLVGGLFDMYNFYCYQNLRGH